jgi:hypothetical protein
MPPVYYIDVLATAFSVIMLPLQASNALLLITACGRLMITESAAKAIDLQLYFCLCIFTPFIKISVYMTMIDPDSIRSYYSQLSNEELIKLAKKEGNRFSEEAIDYLYEEIVRRGLDISIVQNVIETKDLNVAVAALDASIVNFAIEAKKSGKSDREILQELMAREVSEAQAALIIRRLPDYNYESAQFDDLISIKSKITLMEAIFPSLLFFGFGAYLWHLGTNSPNYVAHFLIGSGFFILGGIFFKKRINKLKTGNNYWVELLKTQPENIVWIKPIVVKDGDILSLYKKTRKYQLFTKDRNELTMTLNKEERGIFFEGVSHLLPHAHIGYTHIIESFYAENSENLINMLLAEQLYNPIDTFESLEDIEKAPHYSIRHLHHHRR